MTQPDPIMQRLGVGLAANHEGDHDLARATFEALWVEIGETGDPLHRCAIAHAMADVQLELIDELAWDVAALAAAEMLTDERLNAAGVPGTTRSLLPSLHLNLADVHRRLRRPAEARQHLRAALANVDSLGNDRYGSVVRGGLAHLQRQLDGDGELRAGRHSARPLEATDR